MKSMFELITLAKYLIHSSVIPSVSTVADKHRFLNSQPPPF
jgi:hypothetical protein